MKSSFLMDCTNVKKTFLHYANFQITAAFLATTLIRVQNFILYVTWLIDEETLHRLSAELAAHFGSMLQNPTSDHERYLRDYVIPKVHGIDTSAPPPPPARKVAEITT